MWDYLFLASGLVLILFTFVVIFGAPFLPTLNNKIEGALDLIDLKSGQTLLELGSGDGRVLKAAAKRGINAVGYELNPILVLYSKLITFGYRKNIKIIWGNYWKMAWPKADGIFVFLLQPYMEKLDKTIVQKSSSNIKLLSFAFHIPNKKPIKERDGFYLYQYKIIEKS